MHRYTEYPSPRRMGSPLPSHTGPAGGGYYKGTNKMKCRILTCETCPIDILYSVIRHQELLFPPHKNSPSVCIFHRQMWFLEFVLDMTESRETGPMYPVLLLTSAPVSGQEAIPTTDDFRIKVGGKLGPIFRQTTDA